MILRHNKREVPLLNTTSTADISFILLVFFLIMTSMDVDKGLQRQLPPPDRDKTEEVADISKGNMLDLQLTSSNKLIADGKPLDIAQLRSRVMTFVGKTADRQRHIISVTVDRKTSYDLYFNVQNEIMAAYKTLRNRYALKTYGREYERCTAAQREKVREYYPQRIAETTVAEAEGGEI